MQKHARDHTAAEGGLGWLSELSLISQPQGGPERGQDDECLTTEDGLLTRAGDPLSEMLPLDSRTVALSRMLGGFSLALRLGIVGRKVSMGLDFHSGQQSLWRMKWDLGLQL